jgi:hypothetical protein
MSVALSAAKIAEKKMSPASQLLALGAFGQSARFVTTGITQLRLLRHTLVRLFVTNATRADREYERLLESSGGKFTDSLERTAERHMNGLR